VTHHDDHQGVRRPRPQDRDADALLRGLAVTGEEAITAFVTDLQNLADQPAPAPSRALAAMLEGGFVPDATLPPITFPVRRKSRWLVSVPLAFAVVGGTVGAASANVLPDPAQRLVSDTVSSITPIHLPKPATKPHPRSPGKPTPTATPTEGQTPEPTETPRSPQLVGDDGGPTSRPSQSGADNRDGHGGDTGTRGGDRPQPSATPRQETDGQDGGGPSPEPTPTSSRGDDGHDGSNGSSSREGGGSEGGR
jgi:uncharacterized membrane protein YgcG